MPKHRTSDAGERIWSHPFRGWLAALVMISGAPMALLFATSRREADRRADKTGRRPPIGWR